MDGAARRGSWDSGESQWPARLAAAAAGAAGLGYAGYFLGQCSRAVADVLRLGTPDAVRLVNALLGCP